MEALCHLAASSSGGVIVNVGAFKGASCVVMARTNPKVTVLAVDTFEGVGEDKGAPLEAEFADNVRGISNICCLRCDSVAAATMVCTEVEAVFVDGDHSRDACLRDLEAWWSKIRSGGLLCGHDCVASCGVPEALAEFCALHGVESTVMNGTCHGFFAVRKP